LRNYETEGQIGLEKTPDEYIQKLVNVFREVKRVLRDDGTLWINIGDSYAQVKGSHSQPKDTSGLIRPKISKICEHCGKEFSGNPGQRFCSAA
jgi:site-specific DNA-methyltransferase (adenine-specific)